MKRINFVIAFLLSVVFSFAQPVQWRGAHRDGKFTDTGLLKKMAGIWPCIGGESGRNRQRIFIGYCNG